MEDQSGGCAFDVERAAVSSAAADVGHDRPRPLLALTLFAETRQVLLQSHQIGHQALPFTARRFRPPRQLGQLVFPSGESLSHLFQLFLFLGAAPCQARFLAFTFMKRAERRLEARPDALVLGAQLLFLCGQPCLLAVVILETGQPMLLLLLPESSGLVGLLLLRSCPRCLGASTSDKARPAVEYHQHQDE